MRWRWFALVGAAAIACRDPGARAVAPVPPTPIAVPTPTAVAVTHAVFTQPPMPTGGACNGVSCSGHGRCFASVRYPYLSGDVSVGCACEPGFHAYGLECIACTSVGATYDVALRTARFRGRVTWNGGAVPKDLAGQVVLYSAGDVGTRDETELGRGAFDVDVLAGRYDIVFKGSPNGGEETEIFVARGVSIGGDMAFDVALPFERVIPTITYSGAPPPPGDDQGTLELVRGTDRVWVPILRNPAPIFVPRGSYDVTYNPPARYELSLPRTSFPLTTHLAIERGALAVDIPIVKVEGTIRGIVEPFDPELSMIGFVATDKVAAGWRADPVAVAAPAFATMLVKGRYDVWLSTRIGHQRIAVRIAHAVDVSSARLDLAMIPPTRLAGRFLIDGAPRDTVVVAIGEGDVGGAVRIQLDPDGTFSQLLPRGTYTLAYEQDPSDSMSTVQALDRIVLTNEVRWELDLNMVTVGASVTIDGVAAAPPTAGMGSLVVIAVGSPATYSIWPDAGTIPAGNYLPAFAFGYPEPPGFPDVSSLPRTPIAITSDTTLAFSLSTRQLTGKVTVNGARSMSSANISISGRSDGAQLGDVSVGSYKTRVVPGTYAVQFNDWSGQSKKGMPRNTRFNLGCINVQ